MTNNFGSKLLTFSCLAAFSLASGGCTARVYYPETGLQRMVLPGLGELKDEEIRAQFEKTVAVKPPLSAGIAWLSEAPAGLRSTWTETPVSEYRRTGVLNAALDALRQEPFASVSMLPTVSADFGQGQPSDMVRALRSAAARFQEDVAILMQTGVSESRGLNFFALGFIPLVTAPLFPGVDLATGASAELCAVDVRTGVMIACARGRGQVERGFLFLTQESHAREEMKERTLTEAAVAAAQNLRAAIAARLAEN